jgi:uncharacterized protein
MKSAKSDDGPRSNRCHALIALIALITFSQTSCARLFHSYDVAPDGLQRAEHELRGYLASGHPDSALSYLNNPKTKNALPKDDLLRLLYEGVAAHYAADYQRSAGAFDRASLLAEDRTTKSISKAALSLMINDLALAYEPSRTERLLLPYYAALSYSNAGKHEDAAVEARRLSALLQMLEDNDDAPPASFRAFFRYFAGTIFEAAGERADADVAYRNAFALDSALMPSLSLPPSDLAQAVVLLEHGFAPHRVQESLIVTLADHETHELDGDRSEDDRRRASSLVAARIVEFANHAGPRTGPPKARTLVVPPPANTKASGKHEDCDSACKEHEDHSYVLRMSWPVMYATGGSGLSRLFIDSLEVPAAAIASISDGVLDDFQREQPVIIARTIARAATKYVITKSAEKKAGKKNEALGDVVGGIANIASTITEQADTRSWHLLPGSISLVRLELPPGKHRLHADGVDLGEIEVVAGRTNVFSRRVWSD